MATAVKTIEMNVFFMAFGLISRGWDGIEAERMGR
jgi:hypothetical protein